MFSFISRKNHSPQDLERVRKEALKTAALLTSGLREMREAWINGGEVFYDQMREYAVTTAENPIGHPTGSNAVAYRLPSDPDVELLFVVYLIPTVDEPACFGLHSHPDCTEETLVLEGEGSTRGEKRIQWSFDVFEPGEEHDYLAEAGSPLLELLVRFRPTKK